MNRMLLICFSLFLLAWSVPLSGAKCSGSQSLKLPSKAPTSMVIDVPDGDKIATTGRAAIWGYVPKQFQPAGKTYRIRSLDKIALPKKSAADTSREAGYPVPYGIKGYTAFVGHDAANLSAPTTIYLRDDLEPVIAAGTALHEFGHIAYWEMVSEAERAIWAPLWISAKERKSLPSEYAGVSEYEGFAECFAAWCAGKLTDKAIKGYFEVLKPP